MPITDAPDETKPDAEDDGFKKKNKTSTKRKRTVSISSEENEPSVQVPAVNAEAAGELPHPPSLDEVSDSEAPPPPGAVEVAAPPLVPHEPPAPAAPAVPAEDEFPELVAVAIEPKVKNDGHREVIKTALPYLRSVMLSREWCTKSPRDQVRHCLGLVDAAGKKFWGQWDHYTRKRTVEDLILQFYYDDVKRRL